MKVEYNATHAGCNGVIDPNKLREMIATRAYFKAEKRGFAKGHEVEDWLEAEREVNKQYFYWTQDAV